MVFTPPQKKKKTCCQKCREILAECQLKCGQKAEVSPVVVMSRALGKVPSAHGKLSGLIDIFKSSFIYIIISICIYLVGIFNINIYYIILPSALRPSWWKLPFFFVPGHGFFSLRPWNATLNPSQRSLELSCASTAETAPQPTNHPRLGLGGGSEMI